MKISVIIPCYNAIDTIGFQLEALARQKSSFPFEIIISDNGSTDGSIDLVEKFRHRFNEFSVVDASGKHGSAYARNLGAKVATGDIFLFCDADDVVGDGWLQAMHHALLKNEFVAGRIKWLKLDGAEHSIGRGVPQNNGLQPFAYPAFLPHAATANLGVRRSVHERVGGFDETWLRLMDTDYCWRIQLSGVKLHFEPAAIVYMRTRNTMRSMMKQAWLWGRFNVLLYKRYLPFGMPELSWKVGLKKWMVIIWRIPQLRKKREIEEWIWKVVWNIGRLDGCIRYRVLAI